MTTDEVIYQVSRGDTSMNDAIAAARTTLPRFLSALDKPPAGASDFHLKLRFGTDPGGPSTSEHLWVGDIRRDGDRLVGLIDNDPAYVSTVSNGQAITIDPARISDWYYALDGRFVGAFTIRVLADEAAGGRDAVAADLPFRLDEPPIPDGAP